MHVSTFYSFKGGVGRTYALLNIAGHLAKIGKKVLIIDFDLEAPGLDPLITHEDLSARRGIVDFVHEYRNSMNDGALRVPPIKDYVGTISLSDVDGNSFTLYAISAGKKDELYGRRLAEIDWRELYDELEGFLLFEDFLAQIKQFYAPDYVLIDSRTGHTDIGGVCTRHLPDSVIAMAFPNTQNREGLANVIKKIRSSSAKRHPDIHLAISRIPYIDDENAILENQLKSFARETGLQNFTRIHHYESMDTLEQRIFTLDRPNTRLAKQFVELAWQLRMLNIEDRDGVLRRLDEPFSPIALQSRLNLAQKSPSSFRVYDKDYLAEVENKYQNDADVLIEVAEHHKRYRVNHKALELLYKAAKLGRVDAWKQIADLENLSGRPELAESAIIEMLQRDGKTAVEIRGAIDVLLRTAKRNNLGPLMDAIDTLSVAEAIDILLPLPALRKNLIIRQKLVRQILPELNDIPENYIQFNSVLLAMVSAGYFAEAIEWANKRELANDDDIAFFFNLAMAKWAESGFPDIADFKSFEIPVDRREPNALQCLALVKWLYGDREAAVKFLGYALEALENYPRTITFSCWSYMDQKTDGFRKEIEEMRSLINEGVEVDGYHLPFFDNRPNQA